MNDRELLDMAAKAAGYTVLDGWSEIVAQKNEGDLYPHKWNPLTDDGDALRLAVKLNIELRFHLAGDIPGVTATYAASTRIPVCREPWGSDKLAATRRAIVLASAGIGARMGIAQ